MVLPAMRSIFRRRAKPARLRCSASAATQLRNTLDAALKMN
jgi:hypothetical protein